MPNDPDALLQELADSLREAGRWDDLFEARLLAARQRLGVPLGGDAATGPAPAGLSDAYRDACLEAGEGWLAAGQHRRAWPYLRSAGARDVMQAALLRDAPSSPTSSSQVPNADPDADSDAAADSAEALIEVALYDGAFPALGLQWLIDHSGTCVAVTTIEQLIGQFEPADAVRCAAVLARRLHHELSENLATAVRRSGGDPQTAAGDPLALLAHHPWLTEGGGSHVDASHLASAVRLARLLEDPHEVRLARDLARYGERLDADWVSADPPPFEEFFPTHRLLFDATLGERVEEALEYFRARAAEPVDPYVASSAEETLLVLLGRLGRDAEALDAYAAIAQREGKTPFSPYAPAPLALAQRSGEWEAYERLMRLRDDPVGLALGRLTR